MFLLLLLIWLMLNGRADADVWITGVIAAGGVYAVLCAMSGLTPKKEFRAVKLVPLFLAYAGLLLWEIIKANVTVIGVIYGGKKPTPKIVHFSSGLQYQASNVLLANSITLTPGTITIELADGEFTVHCLMEEYGEGLAESNFVKLLQRMEKVWQK